MFLHLLVQSSGAQTGQEEDWSQFRGPGGHGRSNSKGTPVTWSDNQNIAWKTDLPGPGASSPVVLSNRIWLTCFTGFATSAAERGDMANLKRHLVCLDLGDGKIVWNTAVPAELPEQERIREDHGYASSTPVVDWDRIYAFSENRVRTPSITMANSYGKPNLATNSMAGAPPRRPRSTKNW